MAQGRRANTTVRLSHSKNAMRYFVYVLGSRRKNDCRTYVGWTTDIKRRTRPT